ncbi:uncharacterized protein [Euwallacea fornicatus]|uniref:uncharacterized protein isoform X1 n=1 Tax=Euwallacea fornicatus TaxID=995702 RepID=UPI00338E4A51
MSKSNSLNRSNSTETEHELDFKDLTASSIQEDINEAATIEEDDYNADISSTNSNTNSNNTENFVNDDDGGGGREVIPSSPPPSYEFVLEENRLKQQESVQSQSPSTPPQAQEIMHKSSKEFYKAVAKQFGITCKMSDHCRCYDCQSHYFDCEYEQNEQEKTDGGLGAGTPVFLHEVMHGSACNIL